MSHRIEFEYFHLKGLPNFPDQRFDLRGKGVSLILGRNFDSSNLNSNASGKSMYFSELAEMITMEPMIGIRGDQMRKGSRELGFSKGGHKYRVIRSFSPSEKLTIFRDGKDQEYKDLKPAKAFFHKLIPYSVQEVKSLLYLDSRVPHPLIRGDNATRKEFFRRFFHMDAAPTMRKIVKAELDAIRESEGSITEVTSRLKMLRERSTSRDPEAIKARLDKLKIRAERLTKMSNDFMEVNRIYRGWIENRDILRSLKAFGITSKEDLDTRLEKLQSKASHLAVQLEKWDSYELALEKNKKNAEQRDRLEKLIGKKFLADPVAGKALCIARRKTCRVAVEDLQIELREAEKLLKHCDAKAIETAELEAGKLRRDISKLEKAKDICPTCGGKFDNTHAKKELRILDGSLTDIQVFLEEAPEKAKATARTIRKVSGMISDIEDKIAFYTDQISYLNELEDLKASRQISPPTDTTREVLERLRDSLKGKLKDLDGATDALRTKAKWIKLDDNQRELAKGDDPTPRLMEVSQKLGQLQSELIEAEALVKEISDLSARRLKLKEVIGEKAALDLLLEAFSKGGMESLMIKAITDRLAMLVNKYSKLVFPEDYRFSFELETQFSFLVHRKYGKGEATSDVRKLSGAESLLFSLILYVALLSFLPETRRLNTLILDEPTATFGPEMIDSFVKFLPVLNSVVNNIIVITPMPYQNYPGAKVWTVAKKNGVSQIFEGSRISLETVNASRRSWSASTKSIRSKARGGRARS